MSAALRHTWSDTDLPESTGVRVRSIPVTTRPCPVLAFRTKAELADAAARFDAALEALRYSNERVAKVLGCSPTLVRRMRGADPERLVPLTPERLEKLPPKVRAAMRALQQLKFDFLQEGK